MDSIYVWNVENMSSLLSKSGVLKSNIFHMHGYSWRCKFVINGSNNDKYSSFYLYRVDDIDSVILKYDAIKSGSIFEHKTQNAITCHWSVEIMHPNLNVKLSSDTPASFIINRAAICRKFIPCDKIQNFITNDDTLQFKICIGHL